MKLAEVHEQISPDEEQCDLCVQEELKRCEKQGYQYIDANTTITPFKTYHWVATTEGMSYNLCDTHYYQVATLQ